MSREINSMDTSQNKDRHRLHEAEVLSKGAVLRWGIKLHMYEKKLDAVTLELSRRLWLRWGRPRQTHWNRVIWLNLSLDHKMYRAIDMGCGLVCRRCGEYGDAARAWCRGRIFYWLFG